MTANTSRQDNRWVALIVLCAGMLMIILDSTITTVALPAIQSDLGFSQSGLAWVVNAYLIAFGGLLLLAGRLGDLAGRRRVLLGGMAVFTLASLLCGLAWSEATLIGARFLQGVGGAAASAVSLGMIVTLFTDPRERATAIGVYSFVAAAGASIGLLAGGVLTQALSWHWIFFVNVPIGAVTFVAATRILRRDTGPGLRAGADVLGAVLVTAGLMVGVVAIVGTSDHGWTSLRTLALGAAAIALLAAFAARQATAATPLLPPRVLRPRNVWGANVVLLLAVAGMLGMFFTAALLLQRVYGYDAVETGLAFLPVSLSIGALSLGLSARLTTRFGARLVLLSGVATIAAGLALLSRAPVDATYTIDLLPGMLLAGVGAGLTFPAVMTLAMSAATPEDSGVASGLINTTQQVGGALGLAVLATLASSRTGAREGVEALADGYGLALTVAAGIAVAAVAFSALVLRREPAAQASAKALPERAALRDAA
jgi:EmrB/QacA subfamily drug resistance transporter